MSTKSLQAIDQELGHVFNRLQSRVKGGCKIWVKVAVEMVNDWRIARKAKEKTIYSELMQIESTLNKCASKEAKAAIGKIQKLKGIIGILIICIGLHPLFFAGARSRTTYSQVRVPQARVIRGGSRPMKRKEGAHA